MGSKKPCPGCGEVKSYRKTTDICEDCQRLMEDGKIYRAIEKKYDLETVSLPNVPHMYPRHDGEFQKAFDDMIRIIGSRAVHRFGEYPVREPVGGGFGTKAYHVKKGCIEALRNLWDASVMASKNEYKRGHRDGSSLLGSLASGDITVKDFNERSLRNSV